jgi:2-polyprenyl-6-methoxyphenol hydroxylase-like FAD-dependent oxidoreductase
MTRSSSTAVLICGAGAAGLTLAIDLARRGVDFVLIDKAPAPFQGSRGKGIQPRSLEVFDDLGVLAPILALGAPYPPVRTHAATGFVDTPLAEGAAPTPAEPYATPWMLPQFLTEGVLRDRLAALGHAPCYGAELAGLSQDADGVDAVLAGGETVRARWLVGADGGRSFVRHALAVDFPGGTLPVRAMVADVELTGLSRDAWHQFGEPIERRISFCPLAGTALFQIQGMAPEGVEVLTVEALNAVVRDRTGRSDIVVHALRWGSLYGMNARLAERYRVGRVLLAGDAAHVHPPTGGQGLNTSLQDAYNLGWKLAAVLAGAPETLIDTYEAERRPIAAGVLGLSTDLLKAARDGGEIRRGREARQLDLGYPDSPLSLPLGRTATLAAGDRAPDAPGHDRSGAPLRVFDLLRGPHWTLLRGPDAPDVASRPGLTSVRVGPDGDFVDDAGHFADAYGLAPDGMVLVRPDGYVAAVAGPGDAAALETYLTPLS